jgi:hypothetical protein
LLAALAGRIYGYAPQQDANPLDRSNRLRLMAKNPWVLGLPIPGITLPYNALVEVTRGEHSGETGWLVGVDPRVEDPIYTVELESRGPDLEVPQSALRLLKKANPDA